MFDDYDYNLLNIVCQSHFAFLVQTDKIQTEEVDKTPREKATAQIGLRVSAELKERLEKRADEEGRTLSNLVIKITEDYLERIEEAKRTLEK